MGTVNAIEGEARDLEFFLGIRNNPRRMIGFLSNEKELT